MGFWRAGRRGEWRCRNWADGLGFGARRSGRVGWGGSAGGRHGQGGGSRESGFGGLKKPVELRRPETVQNRPRKAVALARNQAYMTTGCFVCDNMCLPQTCVSHPETVPFFKAVLGRSISRCDMTRVASLRRVWESGEGLRASDQGLPLDLSRTMSWS